MIFFKNSWMWLILILIGMILFVGCRSLFRKEPKKLAKWYHRDCSYIDLLFSYEELNSWRLDSLGEKGLRKGIYFSRPDAFKKVNSFLGISVDCLEERLGRPVFWKEDLERFVDIGVNAVGYNIYSMNPAKNQRDSSIYFQLHFYEKDRRIFDFRLGISEDPNYVAPTGIQDIPMCDSLIERMLYFQRTTTQESDSFSPRKILRYRSTLMFLDGIKPYLSQPCVENWFGKADRYHYIYYSDYGFVTAIYYSLTDSLARPTVLSYDMETLKVWNGLIPPTYCP